MVGTPVLQTPIHTHPNMCARTSPHAHAHAHTYRPLLPPPPLGHMPSSPPLTAPPPPAHTPAPRTSPTRSGSVAVPLPASGPSTALRVPTYSTPSWKSWCSCMICETVGAQCVCVCVCVCS